jgi:heterogeneous nuclear ribonucleoprotein F/H
MVRLRGLPYSAQEKDITDFFQPLVPIRVNMDFDQFGRPSGEAEVFFQSHEDAQSAMKKNNQHIGKLCVFKLLCTVLLRGFPRNSE